MRAYFFGNMYLSSIQQGIQAAHVTAEMFTKYKMYGAEARVPTQQLAILEHWASDHKTMVLLNAGYGEEIHSLVTLFNTTENPLPWAHFNEGKDALDGALTCVGIILPEEFYEGSKEYKAHGPSAFLGSELTPNFNKLQTQWERDFAIRLNNYGLAK